MPGPPDQLLTQPRDNQRGTFYSQLALEPRQMASEPCPTPGTGSGTWERRSGPWGWARGPGWGRGPSPCGAFCFILADTCISSPPIPRHMEAISSALGHHQNHGV